MTDMHFLELAARIGDHVARTQLKEVWDAIDPPTELEVSAFLERQSRSGGPFTDEQRFAGRSQLMALMVEQSLGHRLDWGNDDEFWGKEEFERAADWPNADTEDEIAAGADAGGKAIPSALAWRETEESDSTRPVIDWGTAGNSYEPLVLGGNAVPNPRGKEDGPAKAMAEMGQLFTDDGTIMVINDGESVYIRRPAGAPADRLRLGENDYALDKVPGIAGVERVVGLTIAGMKTFLQEHLEDSDHSSWGD